MCALLETSFLFHVQLALQIPNPRGEMGYTPMHEAAINGRLDICRLIMDQVAEKNPANMLRETPLHIAAMYGRLELCQTIMDRVAEKSPYDQYGKTPLDWAKQNGHTDVALYIISRLIQEHASPCGCRRRLLQR